MFSRLGQWFSGKISIRKKLVISFTLLVSVPIFILGIYAYRESNRNLIHQTEETMSNNISRLVIEMDNKFQRENDFVKSQAYNLRLREALEKNPYDNEKLAQVLNDSVEPGLWYFITSDVNIKEIKIITPYIHNPIGKFLEPAEIYENEEWYQKQQEIFKTSWYVEDERLMAYRTILDSATSSRMLGIMRTEFYLNRFIEPITSLNYLGNGICVVDAKGNSIYKRSVENEQVENAVQKVIQTLQPGQDQSNDQYILKSASVAASGWEIYYYIDKGMISEQISTIITSTLMVVAVCIAVVFIIISLLSRMLSKRILTLKEYAEEISAGNLEYSCHTEDTDEIGIVTNSLGKMTERLNEMINQVYKIEIEKKRAELQALQAMINPHFLYNCLSSIKWKAIRKGDDDISDIAGLTAKFYRTSLNNGKQITTVRSELENIRAYVEIERATHDNSFDVEYEVEEESLDYNMLNFLLQPIVENAIKHGIDYKEDEDVKGKVKIIFLRQDEFLIFHIYNNGSSLDVEHVDEILNSPGTGYGLYNIRERIAMYYGEGSGLSAKVSEDGQTCFTVRIYKEVLGG